MQFPKSMDLKLINNDTLTINFKNQVFDKARGIFEVTFMISEELVNSELDKDVISFEMEDK
jgi:hypothetical protein